MRRLATMEVRATVSTDTAKVEKLLQEGLRARASPAERLHCVLWRVILSPPPAGHGTAVKLAGAWRPRWAPHFVWSFRSAQEVPAALKGTGQGCYALPMARKLPQESRHHTCPPWLRRVELPRWCPEAGVLAWLLNVEPGKPHAESSRRGE